MNKETILDALRTAHHSLTVIHGATAFDTTEPFYNALRSDYDANDAFREFTDATWKVDETAALAKIDAAIAELTGEATHATD